MNVDVLITIGLILQMLALALALMPEDPKKFAARMQIIANMDPENITLDDICAIVNTKMRKNAQRILNAAVKEGYIIRKEQRGYTFYSLAAE